jgi:hypothetical protein
MSTSRHRVLNPDNPGWVQAIARCVRRAFLAGGQYAHRRAWVEDRLAEISGVFACSVAAYAVMSNHVHVVVLMEPERAAGWSDLEVAERWCRLFGKTMPKAPDGSVPQAYVVALSQQPGWVAERRKRLASLPWFMRALCEEIARRANVEDDCTGRFWEGRYTSVPLLDQAALVACMAYVDLNPIRAKQADRPEASLYTGVRQRIAARTRRQAPEAGSAPRTWLAPLSRCAVPQAWSSDQLSGISEDDYLELVDATGRMLAAGKRGAIPAGLAPILARLDLRVSDWLATHQGWRSMQGGAVGQVASRIAEAARRGRRWVRNRCPLFAQPPSATQAVA